MSAASLAGESAQEPEDAAWFEALRPVCEEVRADLRSGYLIEVVLFYLARWCQKTAGSAEPDLSSFAADELRDAAERIARHLAKHGDLVERVVQGERSADATLRGYVGRSARSRVAVTAARHFTDEAMQKIALVLLTGTSPSQAAGRLREGPRGPSNEYVFESPFPNWARTVVINLIKDAWREGSKVGPLPAAAREAGVDREFVERCQAALPGLLEAIRALPRLQRQVMILSLSRSDVDEVAREGLYELAPDLFEEMWHLPLSSDRDIAELMGSKARNVAANRSAARCKLADQHDDWAAILDILLPHRSTRLAKAKADA